MGCVNQSIQWAKHLLCKQALCRSWHIPVFSSMHQSIGSKVCETSLCTRRCKVCKAFWQGSSLLYSQSPKLVKYQPYSTSIPHIKNLNRVKAASTELHGFQYASLRGLVKSPAVSQEDDIAVIQHINSVALLASFLCFVRKKTAGKILTYSTCFQICRGICRSYKPYYTGNLFFKILIFSILYRKIISQDLLHQRKRTLLI